MPMRSPDGASRPTSRLKGAQGKFCAVATRSTLLLRRVAPKGTSACLNCEESYFTVPLFNEVDSVQTRLPLNV